MQYFGAEGLGLRIRPESQGSRNKNIRFFAAVLKWHFGMNALL